MGKRRLTVARNDSAREHAHVGEIESFYKSCEKMLDDCVSSVHLERDLEHELEEKEHNLASKNDQLQLLHKACVNDTSRLEVENALLKKQIDAELAALERERELHGNETKQW